jgi:hypothetical protein
MHTGYIKPRWSDCYVSFTSFNHTSDYINIERNNHNFKSSEAYRCKVNHLLSPFQFTVRSFDEQGGGRVLERGCITPEPLR